jgi:NTE family protein
MSLRKNHIALVLGSGGARGLAHIGVIKCLEENHIPIHSVVGTSIGAFIGGLYTSGIDAGGMEEVVRTMDKFTMAKILMPRFSTSGIVNNVRVKKFIKKLIGEKRIEDLPMVFRAVSTDLITGEEVVLDKGLLVDAILASIAIPAVFQPVYHHGRYLVDGGLCNPLPISVAQRIHAQYSIAVNVSPKPERIQKRIQKKTNEKDIRKKNTQPLWLFNLLHTRGYTFSVDTTRIPALGTREPHDIYFPTALRVTLQSISISAHNLIAQHLKQAQPDVLISPRIEEYDMLEFYKGVDIIQCGYDAAKLAMPKIQSLL